MNDLPKKSTIKGQEIASKDGYSQTLWLDGKEKRYVEEVGRMNIFFKMNETVVTPALMVVSFQVLHVIQLLKSKNIPVEERRISIDEVIEAYHNGTLEEAFGKRRILKWSYKRICHQKE
ncbi:aminotransferase class IV [Niallia oryzisoli]|uniref:Aminotransferase class IV n=1 Tax=Niallia oryzisoli TaxID=1737571 RepID=A0ABZ2CLL8_9BACI